MQAQVVRLNTPKTIISADSLTVELRREMYAHDVDWLAAQAGVRTSTIYAIRSGRTKWPRGTTLFPILRAMGYTLVLKKER